MRVLKIEEVKNVSGGCLLSLLFGGWGRRSSNTTVVNNYGGCGSNGGYGMSGGYGMGNMGGYSMGGHGGRGGRGGRGGYSNGGCGC